MPTTRTTKPAKKTAPKKSVAVKTTSAPRMSLDEVMLVLEKSGSAQTKKTYARHGAKEPMFGVLFGTLKKLVDRIGVDHELARALWKTKNQDARNLAMKIADPAKISSAELDRWVKENTLGMCSAYIASLAAESPHANAKVRDWLESPEEKMRAAGWTLVAQMANLDEKTPDSWFEQCLARIETTVHSMPSGERGAMNGAVIAIGGRNAKLRTIATAAAKRIGPVEVDHGDTSCKTPDAVVYIGKLWERAKKFDSPAVAERARESMRTRC